MPVSINNKSIDKINPPLMYLLDGKIVNVNINDIISIRRPEMAITDLYQFRVSSYDLNEYMGAITLIHYGSICDDGTVINKVDN